MDNEAYAGGMSNVFMAADARRLVAAKSATCQEHVNALVRQAESRIKKACGEGRWSVENPFDGLRLSATSDEKKAALDVMLSRGFSSSQLRQTNAPLVLSWNH